MLEQQNIINDSYVENTIKHNQSTRIEQKSQNDQYMICHEKEFFLNIKDKNQDEENCSSDDECLSILQRELNQDTNIQSQKTKENSDLNTISAFFEDTREDETSQVTTCTCTKSNCMRLSCSCFKLQGYCSPQCRCQNCLNQIAYQNVRDFVLEKTKFINRAAFRENYFQYKGTVIGKKGCKCEKGCLKGYCSCYKNKAQCSSICKCVCCDNNKVHLEKEEVQGIYEYLPRKKYKITIDVSHDMQLSQNKQFFKVSFDNYKNKQIRLLIYKWEIILNISQNQAIYQIFNFSFYKFFIFQKLFF